MIKKSGRRCKVGKIENGITEYWSLLETNVNMMIRIEWGVWSNTAYCKDIKGTLMHYLALPYLDILPLYFKGL